MGVREQYVRLLDGLPTVDTNVGVQEYYLNSKPGPSPTNTNAATSTSLA